MDGFAKASALGRRAQSNQIAPAIVYLASDLAGYASGANLVIDGGWLAANLTGQFEL